MCIVIGINTSVMKKPIEACKKRVGKHFLNTLVVHPEMIDVHEKVTAMTAGQSEYSSQGTMLLPHVKTLMRSLGEMAKVTEILEFPRKSSLKHC